MVKQLADNRISDDMNSLILRAATQRIGRGVSEIEKVSLSTILTNTTGLGFNANGAFALAHQQTPSGGFYDGREYLLKPDPKGRRIKRIKARFAYPLNQSALSSFYWQLDNVGNSGMPILGLRDAIIGQIGFDMYSDIHNPTRRNSGWDNFLERTFTTPVQLERLSLRIGGRSEYPFERMYMRDLEIEFVS